MHYSAASFDIPKAMQEALAAHQRGDFDAAAAQYIKVLREMPENADATHFLGLLEHQRGNTLAALPLLHRSIELSPDNSMYHHNLAGVYKDMEKYSEAERYYKSAVSIRADYLDSYIGLAAINVAQGEHAKALSNCGRALNIDPSNFAALVKMAEALHGSGKDDEAAQIYLRLKDISRHDARKLRLIGMGLHAIGQNAEATNCLRKASEINPDSWETYNSLGMVLGDAGDLPGAEISYRNSLRLKPDAINVFHNLVNLVRLDPHDPLWQPLMDLSARLPEFSPKEAIPLHFALGAVWDYMGSYDQAFRHFMQGNLKKRATLAYEESRQTRFCQNCKQYFSSDFITKNAQIGRGRNIPFVPIFIVGMSRSGTTLVEQILASHPQVYGAGETEQLWCTVRNELNSSARNDDDVPALLTAHDPVIFQRIADRYRAALQATSPSARYITDKLSGNAALIGLIHVAFPRAKIIYCVRDPLDTCVSCFSKLFTYGHLFSYDLGELGRFYRLYASLMKHWTQLLSNDRILEVRYENVVTDLEGQTRRLLKFCDLDWDAKCMRFYETTRTVGTASQIQVRQHIYIHSIGRWRHYEKYLDPLKQALAD